MQPPSHHNILRTYGTLLITLYLVYYIPIDSFATDAPIKTALMALSIVVLFTYTFNVSKAFLLGILYLSVQYTIASFHPDTFRWSTHIYSLLLVMTYVCFYNLVFINRIFSIEYFIKICKWMMMAYFVVCIIQQFLIIIGVTYFPLANLILNLNRGIGCQSLSMEPSHFARIMLVFYYAYIKCNEYKRDEGPFTLKELFSGEHKWVTIRFVWMMTTMGSGTAFVCLILLSLYFVRKSNWYYVLPTLLILYGLIQASGIEHLDRATGVMNNVVMLDKEGAMEADGSGAGRVAPFLNSLNADFTKFETWFGYGTDYTRKNKLFINHTNTLFDDYGFIFYVISLTLNLSCAFKFWSLGTIYMFAGIGGGSGGNIQYGWALMMVMTCVRYFYENRYNPEIYEDEEEEEEEEDCENEEIEKTVQSAIE